MFWRLTQGDSDQRMLGFKQIFDYNSDLLKGLAVLKQVEDDVQVDKRGCRGDASNAIVEPNSTGTSSNNGI